jgi:hydroxymethylglutaryl-CoA lyase
MDMAIGGLGGCPLAQDAMVGNLATELAIAELRRLGADLPELAPLDGIVSASESIARKFGAAIQ